MDPIKVASLLTLITALAVIFMLEDIPRSKRNLRMTWMAGNFLVVVWCVAIWVALKNGGVL